VCLLLWYRKSLQVESSLEELISMLTQPLTEKELENLTPVEGSEDVGAYKTVMNIFLQKNTEALIKCRYN
jgi:hypothetical protein